VLEQVYLFGSYAQGNPNNTSDIDVFVVADLSKKKKLKLRNRLAAYF